jgi:excisionase family DNA binding protein
MNAGITSLLSPEQIADATGLHYMTILDFCRRGELRALKIGNRWKVRPEDYDAWLESKRVEPRQDQPPPQPPTRLRATKSRWDGPGSASDLAEIERRAGLS